MTDIAAHARFIAVLARYRSAPTTDDALKAAVSDILAPADFLVMTGAAISQRLDKGKGRTLEMGRAIRAGIEGPDASDRG